MKQKSISTHWQDFRIILLVVCMALFLTNCSPLPKIPTYPVPPPASFSASGSRKMPDRWWTVFEDGRLNTLVSRALTSNFDLEVAWNRFREARAVADRESSFLFPHLDAFADGEVNRGGAEDGELIRTGIMADYEVDLWGRIKAGVEAEHYRARADLADYRAAALSLSAEVALTWFRLMEAESQLALFDRQMETNRKVLDLIRTRFGSGQSRIADLLRQQQLLESTREQRLSEESRLRVLKHQLAVLLGRPPQKGISYIPKELPKLLPLPETGLPVKLLRRRPDVQTALNKLMATDRELAAAISSQYPRLTLTASLSTGNNGSSDLFEDWLRSVAGDLIGPLFDAGQRKAEVDRAEALKKQRLYEYGRTILSAFQEVEDALIREDRQAMKIESLEKQVRLARKTYERLEDEYFNGAGDYIDVLVVLTEEQQLRRDLLTARLGILEFRIALYRALAGGFTTERESEGKT